MKEAIRKITALTMAFIMSLSLVAYTGNTFTANAASAKSISIRKRPTLKYSSVKTTSVKLKWTKTKKATSYRIYRSTDGKKWKLVKKTKKTSATVKKLKSDKKYYFRVKAYRKGGKIKKSPYSKRITVKTKKAAVKKTPTETDGGIKLKPVTSKTAKKIADSSAMFFKFDSYEGKSADGKTIVVYAKTSSGWCGRDKNGTRYDASGNYVYCEYCGLQMGKKNNMCDGDCAVVFH